MVGREISCPYTCRIVIAFTTCQRHVPTTSLITNFSSMFFNFTKSSIAAIVLFGGMLSMTGCKEAAPQSFIISGTFKEVPDSVKVSLVDMTKGARGEVLCDTIITDNTFTFTGVAEKPVMAKLSFKKMNRRTFPVSVDFVLENVEYTVNCDEPFDSVISSYQPGEIVSIKGGKLQNQYLEYFNALKDVELASRKANYLHAQKWFDTNNNPDTMAVYDAIEAEAKAKYMAADMDFIKSHPSYYISAYKVWSKLAEIYTRTPEEIDEMVAVVQVCPDTAIVNSVNRRRDFTVNHALGIQFKDFAMTTVEGDTVAFAPIASNGKPTFVDFWASWCGPCRAAIPHVKETAKKYGDRLDIISVSCDRDNDAWRAAMKDEKMSWPQYHLEGEKQINDAAQTYMLSSIPRLLIFDKDGILVCSTNLPKEADKALQQILEE